MLKLFSVILSASSLFVISLIMGPDPSVHVTIDSPARVKPGEEFTVTMTVHKGHTLGFARIQQFIPEGFHAELIESRNAQFIEDENSIKFIWMQMPEGEKFDVSYKLIVSKDIRGLQVFNGVLIYIEDEKTEQYALPPLEILVSENGEMAGEGKRPNVERTLIATVPELNEYRVELRIKPNQEERSARFIDRIPEGYSAFEENSHGAEFTFSDGAVSFNWIQMPDDSLFIISYLVRSAQRRTPPSINGMLVYGNSAMNMELDSIDIHDELYEQALKVTEESADKIIDELIAHENDKKQIPDENTASANETMISVPGAKAGVYYKVQIAATIKSPARDNQWFSKYYKMTENVDLTYHEGWKKYLIGTFENYREANLHKQKTRARVNDAFVVAYQDGQRISLKEAQNIKQLNQ